MSWVKRSKFYRHFTHFSASITKKIAYHLSINLRFFCCFSVPVVLVGNKTDLHQERAVSHEEGKKLAESWRATFLETSAKQNEVNFA